MVAIFIRSAIILPLATTLSYCSGTGNTIGIISRSRHVPFAVSWHTAARWRCTRSFACPRHMPVLNEAHPLIVRGGDIGNSHGGGDSSDSIESLDRDGDRAQSIVGREESNLADPQVVKPTDVETDVANNNEIYSPDDVWAEEIKRLQLFLSSPQSKISHTQDTNVHNGKPLENSDAHDTREVVLGLGSTLTTKEENDADDKYLEFTPSFDETRSDTSVTCSLQSSSYNEEEDMMFVDSEMLTRSHCDGDGSHIIYETTESDSMPTFHQNETQDIRNGGRIDDASSELELDVDVPDAFDMERVDIDAGMSHGKTISSYSDEGHKEETPLNLIDAEAIQKGLGSVDKVLSNDSSNLVVLTDAAEDINDAFNQLERDMSEPTHLWESAPAVVESNKLVEEGLRKLRRTNGDEPSVPYVITRAMKRVLVDELGYDEQEVQSMRPDVAVVVVSENLRRSSVASLPARFYNDDITPFTKNELTHQVGFRHKIRSFIERLNFKECTIMLGSIMTVSYSLVSKARRVPSDKQPKTHENNQKGPTEKNVENDSFEASNEVLLQSDLDRTWLERLISMLTFYK